MQPSPNLDLPEGQQYGPRGFRGVWDAFSEISRRKRQSVGAGRHVATGAKTMDEKDKPSADEAALSARLHHLEDRLSATRKDRNLQTGQSDGGDGNASANASAMARGFRLSSELIAGVLVGAAIGWGFDRLLSTSPWGLIVFFLLGFAAGVINVMRAAGVANKPTDRQ
jgi:ATP synthase protein I